MVERPENEEEKKFREIFSVWEKERRKKQEGESEQRKKIIVNLHNKNPGSHGYFFSHHCQVSSRRFSLTL